MPHVIDLPRPAFSDETLRLRWSAERYESLFHAGILPQKGYELLEGDIVEKMPVKKTHSKTITLLFALFSRLCGFDVLLSQFTLALDEQNTPEPDFAVLTTPNPALSERGYVRPDAVRLVVEVSDATLQTDLTVKARLYARAGIAEYWVLDLNNRRLRLHIQPGADGYELVTEYADNETAAPVFMPSAAFLVADVLPPLL